MGRARSAGCERANAGPAPFITCEPVLRAACDRNISDLVENANKHIDIFKKASSPAEEQILTRAKVFCYTHPDGIYYLPKRGRERERAWCELHEFCTSLPLTRKSLPIAPIITVPDEHRAERLLCCFRLASSIRNTNRELDSEQLSLVASP